MEPDDYRPTGDRQSVIILLLTRIAAWSGGVSSAGRQEAQGENQTEPAKSPKFSPRKWGLGMTVVVIVATTLFGWWLYKEVRDTYRSMSTSAGLRPAW